MQNAVKAFLVTNLQRYIKFRNPPQKTTEKLQKKRGKAISPPLMPVVACGAGRGAHLPQACRLGDSLAESVLEEV